MRRLAQAVGAAVALAAVAVGGCGQANDPRPDPTPSGTPASSRAIFDPPTRFDVTSPVTLPVQAARGDRGAGGDLVGGLPVQLHHTTAFIAARDSLQAVDTDSGAVRATVTPRHPPAFTSDGAGTTGGHNPALATVDGRRVVVTPFLVRTPGQGTTAGRRIVELVALDAATAQTAWTVDIDLPPWVQQTLDTLRAAAVGVHEHLLVLSVGGPFNAETLAVDLTTRRIVWQRTGYRAGALANGTVVGTTGIGGSESIAALAVGDGSQRWSSNAGRTAATVRPGSPSIVTASGRDTDGRPYSRLLDAATGTVKDTSHGTGNQLYDVDCHHDGAAITVCGQTAGATGWAGAFDEAGAWLWQLPDQAANRIAPRITTAWHGVAYGATPDGPVILDARTGRGKEPAPGIAPLAVNGYVGLAGVTEGMTVRVRAHRTIG